MKDLYVGDSYDHVKRTLIEASVASNWVAAPMLTTKMSSPEIASYKQFLKVTVPKQFLFSPPRHQRNEYFTKLGLYIGKNKRHIFLDPCKGIRLSNKLSATIPEYVTIAEIVTLLSFDNETLLLCYDQSLSRGLEDQQRSTKLSTLKAHKINAFYFKSHTSFICASNNARRLEHWKASLIKMGIPRKRIQTA